MDKHWEIYLNLLCASLAPVPSLEYIQQQARIDRNRNPHNDSYHPPLRSDQEIIADYKIEFVKTLRARLLSSNGSLLPISL